jgi:hypothetical protein
MSAKCHLAIKAGLVPRYVATTRRWVKDYLHNYYLDMVRRSYAPCNHCMRGRKRSNSYRQDMPEGYSNILNSMPPRQFRHSHQAAIRQWYYQACKELSMSGGRMTMRFRLRPVTIG